MYKLLKFYERKAVEYLEKYMKEKKESDMWYKTYKYWEDEYYKCLDMKKYWKKLFNGLSLLCLCLIVLMFYFMYLLLC